MRIGDQHPYITSRLKQQDPIVTEFHLFKIFRFYENVLNLKNILFYNLNNKVPSEN